MRTGKLCLAQKLCHHRGPEVQKDVAVVSGIRTDWGVRGKAGHKIGFQMPQVDKAG